MSDRLPELSLPLPAEWLDALAGAVAERLGGVQPMQQSPWLTLPQAAAYLGVSEAKLKHDRTVPSHKWEGRRLWHRAELDEFLLGLGD